MQGGSRSMVVNRVPGGGVNFFSAFFKNQVTTMVVNLGVGVRIFGFLSILIYYQVVNSNLFCHVKELS